MSPPKAATTSQGYNRPKLIQRNNSIQTTSALARERIIWLGVATTVAYEDIKDRFPILSGAAGQGSSTASLLAELDRLIQSRFAEHGAFPGFDLVGQTEEQRPSDLGMALLLNQESSRTEQVSEGTGRSEYSLVGQVVFIDQQKQEICASFPIGHALSDSGDAAELSLPEMAKKVLLGTDQVSSNSSSVIRKFFKVLDDTRLSVRSDYCFEVGAVTIAEQCSQPGILHQKIKPCSFSRDELSGWEGEVGPILVNYLAYDSGRVFNPYVSKTGGKDNILALHFLKGASRIVRTDGPVSLKLRPPVRRFDLSLTNLTCEVDQQWSGKYVVNLIFGIQGVLSLTEPVTGREVLRHAFNVSLSGFKALPKDLREQYWQKARRKLTPAQFEAATYDAKFSWKNSLDNFLNQIASELLFEQSDKAGRFGQLRSELDRIAHAQSKPAPAMTRK